MVTTIFNRNGEAKVELSPDDSSTQVKEVQGDSVLTLSFTHYEHIDLDVDDYADFFGERFWLTEKCRPRQNSRKEWVYDLKLYGVESMIKRLLVINNTDGEEEPVFTLTAPPRDHVALIVKCMNSGMGNISDWKVGQVNGTENIVIDYFGKYCDEALREIAEKVGAEWWVEGQTVNICKCEHGEPVSLGYGKGLTSIDPDTADNVKFYTRLYPVGSSRNIDREKYGHTRLQLPGGAKYVEINADKYGRVDHYEADAFADIYPRRTGEVSSVRSEVRTAKDGNPFTVYYFTDNSLPFDPNDYEIGGLVKRVSFQEGSELAGLGEEENGTYYFEVNFNSTTREFEIITIWPYDNDMQLPGDKLVPKAGNKYILWNLRMPDEYYALAEEEFLTAVNEYNASHALDIAVYKASTDHVWIEDNKVAVTVGSRVRLESEEYFPETGFRESRITKITRKVNLPSSMDIEIGDALSRTSMQKMSDSISEARSYARTIAGSVSLPDIIRTGDSTAPTDNNLFSARRVERDFLSKRSPDTAQGEINFLRGLTAFEDARPGHFGGRGVCVYEDEGGNAVGEFDIVVARKEFITNALTVNQISTMGGMRIMSGATMKVTSVEWDEANRDWICRFDTMDGTLGNHFRPGDFALSLRFDAANGAAKYYRRRVDYVGDGLVALVGDDSIAGDVDGTGIPEAGDVVAQFGNADDPTRRYAIVEDVTSGAYTVYLKDLSTVSSRGAEFYFCGRRGGSGLRFLVGDIEDQHFRWENGELNICGAISMKSTFNGKTLDDYINDRVTQLAGATIATEYSATGGTSSTEWHTSPQEGDVYMRVSTDGGKTWGSPVWIGGSNFTPNLLLGSRVPKSAAYEVGSWMFDGEGPADGETLTATVWGSLGAGKEYFRVFNSGGMLPVGQLREVSPGVYSAKVKWAVGSTSNTFMRIYAHPSSVTSPSTVERVKLERGANPAPQWTPAATEMTGQDGRWLATQWGVNTDPLNPPAEAAFTDRPATPQPGEYVWIRQGWVIPPATAPAEWLTPYQRITGDAGMKGESAYRLDVDNEVVPVACDADGNPLTASHATVAVSVYRGTERLDPSRVKLTAQTSGKVTASVGTGTVGLSSLGSDRAQVTLTATVEPDSVTLTTVLTLYKVIPGKNGTDGADGAPAVVYEIEPSAPFVMRDPNDPTAEQSLSCTKYRTEGAQGRRETTEKRLVAQRTGVDGAPFTVAAPGTSSGAVRVTAETTQVVLTLLDDDGTVLDRERVFVLSDQLAQDCGGVNLLRNSAMLYGGKYWAAAAGQQTDPSTSLGGCAAMKLGTALDLVRTMNAKQWEELTTAGGHTVQLQSGESREGVRRGELFTVTATVTTTVGSYVRTATFRATTDSGDLTGDLWKADDNASTNWFRGVEQDGRAECANPHLTATPGRAVTLSAWLMTDDPARLEGAALQLTFLDAAGEALLRRSVNAVPSAAGVWERRHLTVTAPEGAVSVGVFAYVTRRGTLWMAQPQLEQGNVLTGWKKSPQDFDYLTEALREDTFRAEGGLILATTAMMGHTDSDGNFRVMSGINGSVDPNDPTGGISIWGGGEMVDAAQVPSDPDRAAFLFRHDGTGYTARDVIRFLLDRMEVGDSVRLTTNGLVLVDSSKEERLRIINGSVGDLTSVKRTVVPLEGELGDTATVTLSRPAGSGQFAAAPVWKVSRGVSLTVTFSGKLSKGTIITLTPKLSFTKQLALSSSGTATEAVDATMVVTLQRRSSEVATPETVKTWSVKATTTDLRTHTATAELECTADADGLYSVVLTLSASPSVGAVTTDTVPASLSLTGQATLGYEAMTTLGNDGLLSVWPQAAFLAKAGEVGALCGRYGIKLTPTGIYATDDGGATAWKNITSTFV